MISGAGLCWQHVGGVGSTTTTTTTTTTVVNASLSCEEHLLGPFGAHVHSQQMFTVNPQFIYYAIITIMFNNSISNQLLFINLYLICQSIGFFFNNLLLVTFL